MLCAYISRGTSKVTMTIAHTSWYNTTESMQVICLLKHIKENFEASIMHSTNFFLKELHNNNNNNIYNTRIKLVIACIRYLYCNKAV